MSGASKNRKYRAAHEASIRRASEEIKIQKAYISFYHQFNSGSPGIASRGTRHIMTPYQNYGPAARGSGRGAVGSPLDSFSWVTPDSYRQRISTAQGTTNVSSFGMNAASYKSIADMLRPKAINAELSNLSGAYASQSQLIKKGPQKAKSKRGKSGGTTSQMMAKMSDGSSRLINTAPSALQKVLMNNQGISTNSKSANSTPDWQKNHKTSTSSKSSKEILAAANKSNPNPNWALANTVGFKGNSSKTGSGVMQSVTSYTASDDDGKQFTFYETNPDVAYGAAINKFTKKDSVSVEGIQNIRKQSAAYFKDETRDKTKDQLVKDELRLYEKAFKDEQRNIYLQNFAFGDGTLSVESGAGRDKKTPSLRNSMKGNLQMIKDKKEYNKQVAQFSLDKANLGLTDAQIHSRINTAKIDTRKDMSSLGGFMTEYEHLKANKNSSQTHRDKVAALNARVKLEFPGMDVGGNSAQMLGKLTNRMDTEKRSLTEINKQQDVMGLYIAKNRIHDITARKGEVTGMKNRDANKARKAAIREADRAAAQKEFDNLWREGAGQALMSDTSESNLNPERMVQAPSKASELTRVVGIVKKYDAWDQRRNYISGELDTRRSNLNTYYNSNWEQDFTVSDTEASQYMFGSDTPSGTSLTRNAVTAIGINQRKPRKAIENINKILAQTGENRSVYAENLAGIETKLLTLKEKQALKKAENDAIKARIAQQVTDDFNAGNVDINTTFRDSITGTSEELYDLNTQVAEHNTIKTYYDKSLAQTDEDTATLKNTLEEIIKVKQQNDYDTITSGADGDGGNKSQSSLGGYNKARRFKRPTGGRKQMVRSGGGKIQRTRSGKGLSGLVI